MIKTTMKNKLTKKQLKEIRDFAATIPQTYCIAKQKMLLSAKEILDIKDGSPSIIELQEKIVSEKIKDEKIFELFFEKQEKVNQYNRIKKVFYQGGEKAVKQYVTEQIELFESQKPIDLHSKII